MCQEAVRKLRNPSESCHVRKVARLLARPLNLLSTVVATLLAAHSGGLDRLTVHDPRAKLRISVQANFAEFHTDRDFGAIKGGGCAFTSAPTPPLILQLLVLVLLLRHQVTICSRTSSSISSRASRRRLRCSRSTTADHCKVGDSANFPRMKSSGSSSCKRSRRRSVTRVTISSAETRSSIALPTRTETASSKSSATSSARSSSGGTYFGPIPCAWSCSST